MCLTVAKHSNNYVQPVSKYSKWLDEFVPVIGWFLSDHPSIRVGKQVTSHRLDDIYEYLSITQHNETCTLSEGCMKSDCYNNGKACLARTCTHTLSKMLYTRGG